jgi:photosystem II stability/assembly factor-like uncharacterized protein
MRSIKEPSNSFAPRPSGKLGLRLRQFLIVPLFILSLPLASHAQWRMLHDFSNPLDDPAGLTSISALYFLDLPGAPRIGFLGITTDDVNFTTASEGGQVWKTIDGGITWTQVGPINDPFFFCKEVNDFVFKDSLTGWMVAAANNADGGCYKTTDGGLTWVRLPGVSGECLSIYYHRVSNRLVLTRSADRFGLTSTDEGTNWQSLNTNFSSCSFSDDLIGILSGIGAPNTIYDGPNSLTTDGGVTWSHVSANLRCSRPLAIQGTKTFFILVDSNRVYRSDDGGSNWMEVFRFPFSNPRFNIEKLFGDLQHMYAQTIYGVFSSSDEGKSWQSFCGPANFLGDIGLQKGFYQKGVYIYAAQLSSPSYGAKLWINTTGLATGPRLNLASESSNQSISEPPGGTATFLIRTPKALPNGFVADSVSVTLNFDSDVASHVTDAAAPGWTIRTVRSEQGSVRIKLVKLAGTTLEPDSVIGTIHFRANLAARTSTSIALGEVDWDSDSSYYDCIASLLGSTDSVQLNVTLSCGDSLMLAALRHEPLFEIASLRPNPASRELRIELTHKLDAPVHIGLFDALGAIKKSFESNRTESTLDVSDLPNGVYYLRVSQSGFVQSRKVVISR